MNKYTPRLLVLALLLINAAAVVIPNFSVPALITAAAVLVVVTIMSFVGEDESLVKKMPWYAAAYVIIGMALPIAPLNQYAMIDGLENLLEAIVSAAEEEMFVFFFIALVALQIFFRNSFNRLFVFLRYFVAWFLLRCIAAELFWYQDYFTNFINILVIVSAVYEMNGLLHVDNRPRMMSTLLLPLLVLFLFCCYGHPLGMQIASFFAPDYDNWLKPVLIVGVVGLLMFAEESYRKAVNKTEDDPCHAELGPVLLFWCLLNVMMHVWDDFMNWNTLMLYFPVVYYFYCVFMRSYRPGNADKVSTLVSWSVITVFMMALAKGLNFMPVVALAMFVLLVVGGFCWSIARRITARNLVMNCYMGIASVLLMTSTVLNSVYELADNIQMLMSVILTSLMWCFVCINTNKLDKNASDVYPAEYSNAILLESIAPAVVIGVALIRILFIL